MSFRDYGDDGAPADLSLLRQVAYNQRLKQIQNTAHYQLIRELSEADSAINLQHDIDRLTSEMKQLSALFQMKSDIVFYKKHLLKAKR